jgi:hypothetical protein
MNAVMYEYYQSVRNFFRHKSTELKRQLSFAARAKHNYRDMACRGLASEHLNAYECSVYTRDGQTTAR